MASVRWRFFCIPAKTYYNLFWQVKTIYYFFFVNITVYVITLQRTIIIQLSLLEKIKWPRFLGVVKWFLSEPNGLWNGEISLLWKQGLKITSYERAFSSWSKIKPIGLELKVYIPKLYESEDPDWKIKLK